MPIVEFVTAEGHRLLINTRREATSLLFDDELALNFDQEGRPTGAWIEGRNYRRGLDNHIIEKQEGPRAGLSYRVRRELDADQASRFIDKVYGLVADYHKILRNPATRVANDAPAGDCQAVLQALDLIAGCDRTRLEREAGVFHHTYKPINILPPDQYLAVVLQATEGCSYNQCTFCGFYRDRAFRVKGMDEFRRHIQDVRALLGKGMSLRKSIFLADANALVIPGAQLEPLLDVLNSEFVIDPAHLSGQPKRAWRISHPDSLDGIYSFVDAFTTRRKTAADWDRMARRGLRRVYIGLESGDAELLKFLGKPNSPEDVLELVRQLKAGGVAVGLIILAGAGGEQFQAAHIRHTAELINMMPLDAGDLIYFSELVNYAGSEYSALARAAGIRPLEIEEIGKQMARLREGFTLNPGRAPKVSYYDVREFIY